jgi:ABC-type transporter Mla subunit MlaD
VAGRAALHVRAVGLLLGVLVDPLGGVGVRDPFGGGDTLDLDRFVGRVSGAVAEGEVFVGAERHGSEVPGCGRGQPPTEVAADRPGPYRVRVRLVPTPRDVIGVVERGSDALEQLLAAAPRVTSLLADVEQLVRRIEATRTAVDELVRRIDGTVARATGLLDRLEPSLTTLQPTLERLAATTDRHEVDALVALLDHLPRLVGQLENDVLPVLTTLSTVAPDLHDLLDSSRELSVLLGKMPGFGLVRKRVEDRQAGLLDDE